MHRHSVARFILFSSPLLSSPLLLFSSNPLFPQMDSGAQASLCFRSYNCRWHKNRFVVYVSNFSLPSFCSHFPPLSDLRSDPSRKSAEAEPFTKEDGERLAKDVGAKMYVECSSFTQDGLKNVFEQAVRVALSGAGGGPSAQGLARHFQLLFIVQFQF